jgi:putative membrane protein
MIFPLVVVYIALRRLRPRADERIRIARGLGAGIVTSSGGFILRAGENGPGAAGYARIIATARVCRLADNRMTVSESMKIAADIAVALVVLLHVYFLALEMFFWDKPLGRRTFGLTPEFAAASKSLAANQGLYNGFLAAGLVWGLQAGEGGHAIKLFFLGCIIIAGVFGAATASKKILFVQALPGAIAMALVLLS